MFVGFTVCVCPIWCSFGLCDAEKSRNMLSVLKCPPTMPCRLADGSCSVTGHHGAQQDVHLQLLMHVALGAFLCPGRRPCFHHHDRPTDGRSSASNGTFVRVQFLASQQTTSPPLPRPRSRWNRIALSV